MGVPVGKPVILDDMEKESTTKFELEWNCQKDESYINWSSYDITKRILSKFYHLFYLMDDFQKFPPMSLIPWRNIVAKVAMRKDALNMMCYMVIKMYPSKWLGSDEDDKLLLKHTVLALMNYSDASSDFAIAVAHYPGFCSKIKEILQDTLEEAEKDKMSESKKQFTVDCLTVAHNLSMQESTIGSLQAVKLHPLLVSYLAVQNNTFRLNACATLAAMAVDNKLFETNTELVSFLLKMLSEASTTRLHRSSIGWSCKKCIFTIDMLAKNDSNKKLLLESGVTQQLVNIGRIGDNDEQYKAVSALRALSISVGNKNKTSNKGELEVVDLFTQLSNSDDERISKVCDGAIPTIISDLKAEAALSEKKSQPADVMISYQWDDQKTLIKIRNKLLKAGITVWMDKYDIKGCMLESIAYGMDQAKVVLICMSQKYMDSRMCKREATYAFDTDKVIVPLKMQMDYTPEGWLRFICPTTTLFFDFSGKYPFKYELSALLTELGKLFQRIGKTGLQLLIGNNQTYPHCRTI